MLKKKTIKCNHQFFEIEKIVKPTPVNNIYEVSHDQTSAVETIPVKYKDLHGIRIGCHLCGQIKTLWENGEIFIEK